MRRYPRPLAWLAALAVTISACVGGGPVGSDPGSDAWRTAALVDVRTGETLVVNDLRGKLVVIEPMAVWCTTCHIQQGEVAAALATIGSADIVYISLDVDPNERADDLAAYADRSGFDWHFVVATSEVARSLAAAFGDQILSPPSTPQILVAPSGEVVDQHFGIREAARLVADFTAQLP